MKGDRWLLGRIFKLILPHRRLFFFAAMLLPLATVIRLSQPAMMKIGIDEYIAPGEFGEGFLWLCAVYGLVLVVDFFLRYAQSYVTELMGQRITYELRGRLMDHAETLSMPFYDRTPTGAVMTRITNDVEVINEFVAGGVTILAADTLMLTGIVVLLFALDWRLALLTLGMMPPLLLLVVRIGAVLRKTYGKLRQSVARFNGCLQENISGMSLIQGFRAEAWAHGKHRRLNGEQLEGEKKAVVYSSFLSAALQLGENLTVALVLWWGARWISEGTLTFGVIVATIDCVHRFIAPLDRLLSRYTVFQQALAAAEKVFRFLDVKEKMPEPATPRDLPGGQLAIRFEGVAFSYDAKVDALQEIDLAIEPGETVAFVGATGAGKSTLAKLLLRFYDPTHGRITLGGVDLRELKLSDLRSRFALVLQDVFLFSGPLELNISMGRPEVTARAVREAARAVQATEIIESLPGGFEAELGERGAGLSSGELQLLSFARALALDPEVLILDEATANVDSRTEAKIQAAVDRLLENRTSLVIAHRLSTIRRADKIVVLHHGRIQEVGTHGELLRNRGLYWHLYQLQFGGKASRSQNISGLATGSISCHSAGY